ncbi:hypothetical protein GGS21DRAFT_548829 [Xylaria nigripes]|nr:hypothetical protein GGS21DRAFT_548829 [Xylaria nigripes]
MFPGALRGLIPQAPANLALFCTPLVADRDPGADSSALAHPVVFKNDPELSDVVEVASVLGNQRRYGYRNLLGMIPFCASVEEAGGAPGGNVNVIILPDWVTVVSRQEVSIDEEVLDEEDVDKAAVDGEAVDGEAVDGEAVHGEAIDEVAVDEEVLDEEDVDKAAVDGEAVDGEAIDEVAVDEEAVDNEVVDKEAVDERVITVVFPDSVIVVSRHVVSVVDVGLGEVKVITVVVPDCVIVVSLHVESQENEELDPVEDTPVVVALPTVDLEEAGVVVMGPDDTADPGRDSDGLGTGVVRSAVPDDSREEVIDKLVVVVVNDELGPSEEVMTEPVDDVITAADEVLLIVPDDTGIGLIIDPVEEADCVTGPVMEPTLPPGVVTACEDESFVITDEKGFVLTDVGPFVVAKLVIPAEGKEAADVMFEADWEADESGDRLLDAEVEPEANVGCVIVTASDVGMRPVEPDLEDIAVLSSVFGRVLSRPELVANDELVTFVIGYNAELDACVIMAEVLLPMLVGLAPEERREVRTAPEEVKDNPVVVGSSLPTAVGVMVSVLRLCVIFDDWSTDDDMLDSVKLLEPVVVFENGYGAVEEPILDPDTPVDNGGLVTGGDPFVDPPGNPGVKPLELILIEVGAVGFVWVEELPLIVRLLLKFPALRLGEKTRDVVNDTPDPVLLETPVGPAVGAVELVSGNGTVPETLDFPMLVALTAGVGGLSPELGVDEVASEEFGSDAVAAEDPVLAGLPVSLLAGILELLTVLEMTVLEDVDALDKASVVVVPELIWDVPAVKVAGSDEFALVVKTDSGLGVVGRPVPGNEEVTVSPVGTEVSVVGNGVTALITAELVALPFVGKAVGSDPEPGTVEELGAMEEVIAGTDVGTNELVDECGVDSLLLDIRPDSEDTGVLASTADVFVGLVTGTDEFAVGNRLVGLTLTKVGLLVGTETDSVVIDADTTVVEEEAALNEFIEEPTAATVELVSGRGLISVGLREPVLVVEMRPEVELTGETDVSVGEFPAVSLMIEDITRLVGTGILCDVDISPGLEATVLVRRLLVDSTVRMDVSVVGNEIVSLALTETLVVAWFDADEPVSSGEVEISVSGAELVVAVDSGIFDVELEKGYGADGMVLLGVLLLMLPVPEIEE